MNSWNKKINKISYLFETHFDKLRYQLKRKMGYDQPLQIVPYTSYGNRTTLYLRGRVFEQRNDSDDVDNVDENSFWDNLLKSYQRFESDEVPNVLLSACFENITMETKTDEEGYFSFNLPVTKPLADAELWHAITLTIPPQSSLQAPLTEAVTAQVMIPAVNCSFGIISDIDDTIMITKAKHLLAMAKLTFLHSPTMRLSFLGVSAFYRALESSGNYLRPFFYVSSSPWNLYDFLVEFMRLNEIPKGALLLRDYGLEADHFFQSSHRKHKLSQIMHVMDTYPTMSFLLIGDSGQHDPEIYAEVVATRAHQVRAIYIRDVSSSQQRDEEVRLLSKQTQLHNIDLLLVADTYAAAEHAVEQGFIKPEKLALIRDDIRKDKA
jgi:phosphatidate phosphatase APP1